MGIQDVSFSDEAAARDPVAQRMFTILEACAERRRPASISALVKRTGLAKSTVHRMSWKMAELGVLFHDENGFSVGTKLTALGNANPVLKSLRAVAIPYLVELQRAAGASQLTLLSSNKVLVVDGLYTKELKAYPLIGASMPIHCTATGKALLARVDEREREEILGSIRLSVATTRTIVSQSRLRNELDMVAKRGYAISTEEFQSGITALAAAFKLGRGLYGAIGTLGSAEESQVLRSARKVVEIAQELQAAFAPEV